MKKETNTRSAKSQLSAPIPRKPSGNNIPDDFLILAWIGPGGDQITPKTMTDLANGGFNASLSYLSPDNMIAQLDMAQEAGVRIIMHVPGMRVSAGEVTDAWKERMRGVIEQVRSHPALLGYYIADEPKIQLMADIAKAFAFFREHDPDHLCYCNHWTTNMSWSGYRSYEEMWDEFGKTCAPEFVSSDYYPFSVVSEEEWLANRDTNPYYYPRHKARIAVQFFEMLDVVRQYSLRWQVPMWMCNYGTYQYAPETRDGEMTFQVMVNLAYGSRCIQYFTYAYNNMMIDPPDATPNENWQAARRINRVLSAWGPTLMKLRSIGVYHYPPNLTGTRSLDQCILGNPSDLFARGDAVVVGQFIDEDAGDEGGWEYALIVNRSPFEPSHTDFHFGTDGPVEELSGESGQWIAPNPYGSSNPRKMALRFLPGQGRLFRYKREIRVT